MIYLYIICTVFIRFRIKNLEEDVRMSGDERRTLIEELETERYS